VRAENFSLTQEPMERKSAAPTIDVAIFLIEGYFIYLGVDFT
jgi:hypothetical protein